MIAAMFVEQQRRSQQEMMLRMISIAIERRIPLSPVLDMFGRDAIGWTEEAGTAMAAAMQAGMPFDTALETAGDPLGDSAGVLVRMGREVNDLGGALRIAAGVERYSIPLWRAFTARCCYLVAISVTMIGIVTFAMLYIVPSMSKIFTEYRLDLPVMTRLVISIANAIDNNPLIAIPMLAIPPLVGVIVARRFVGHSRHDLSRTGRPGMPLHRACILETLSLAASTGRPMEAATAMLSVVYPRRFIQVRLGRAHQLMQHGADWLESLHHAAILRRSDVAALRASQQFGNLSWTMRELAAASRRRFLQRLQAISVVVAPLVLVGIGFVVFVIVLSMFLPLISLVIGLT